MYYLKCIEKLRNTNNQIVGYVFVDKQGRYYGVNEKSVSSDLIKGVKNIRTLKRAIKNKSIEIVNLQLTSDGKLIDKKVELKEIGTEKEMTDFKQLIREELFNLQKEGETEKDSISFSFNQLEKIIYFICMYILEKEEYNKVPFKSIKSKVTNKGNGGSYIRLSDFVFVDYNFKIEGLVSPIEIDIRITSLDELKNNGWALSKLMVTYKHMSGEHMYSGTAEDRTFITVTSESLKELIDNLNTPINPYAYIEYKKGSNLK